MNCLLSASGGYWLEETPRLQDQGIPGENRILAAGAQKVYITEAAPINQYSVMFPPIN